MLMFGLIPLWVGTLLGGWIGFELGRLTASAHATGTRRARTWRT